jgi:hypothetical protein
MLITPGSTHKHWTVWPCGVRFGAASRRLIAFAVATECAPVAIVPQRARSPAAEPETRLAIWNGWKCRGVGGGRPPGLDPLKGYVHFAKSISKPLLISK